MDGARAGDKIRTHHLRVVEKDGAISARYKDRITVLGINKISIGEICGVVCIRETMPRQCRKEGSGTAGYISTAPGNVCKCFIDRTDRCEIRCGVLCRFSIQRPFVLDETVNLLCLWRHYIAPSRQRRRLGLAPPWYLFDLRAK